MKIRNKIFVPTAMVIAVVLVVAIGGLITHNARVSREETVALAREMAERNAVQVKISIDAAMSTARMLANLFEAAAERPETADRKVLDAVLVKAMYSHDNYFGTWVAFEPDALDGRDSFFRGKDGHDESGMYYPYFYRDGDSFAVDFNSDYRTEDYYQLAWKSGREVVMEPYTEEDSAGVLISSVCVPIKKGEEVIGVCGIDFALKDFQVMVETIRPFGVGYGFLVSNNGVFVGHPDPGLLGKGIDSERWGDGTRKIERSIREGVEFSETFEQDGGVLAIGVPLRIGATDTPWSFGIIVPRQVITAGARQLVRMGAFIGLCALAVLFLAVYLVARVISEPLGRTAQMLLALEGGDLDSRLGMRRDDEIGRMARALDSFADHLRDEVLEAFQKLSQGNFTFRARGVIANPLARTNVALNMVMRQVQTLAGEVGKGAGQVSMSSRSLSRGAGEQAASLEEISSHVSEVETLTRKNVDSAAGMARVSGRARDLVREGAAKMEVMTGAMDEIRSSSQNIAKVIKVIEEIAFQTNLLALNAAVEAARAGQHGKGFAVVAEEVRNLAGRSAQAAQSTRDMIEDSISKAETGAEVSKTTAEFLAGIKENVDSMAGMMDAIAAGSEQQARAMSRIIEGVNQVSVVTEQNSASAEENASIAAALDSRVRELQRILNGFVLDGGDTGSNLGRERLESGMAEVGYECGSLSAGERLSRI